jgi:uncharacterized protein YndB with AHSA1/START domain
MQETRRTKVLPGARKRACGLRRTRRHSLPTTNTAKAWHLFFRRVGEAAKLHELRRKREHRNEAHGEIAPEGDGTRYTARARHWSDEARKQHEEMGFVAGWQACADQLKALSEGD